MGIARDWTLLILGWASIGFGALTILAGMILLLRTLVLPKGIGGADGTFDLSKALEALGKLPLWAAAIVVGYVQIVMGFWMLGETVFKYKMFPPYL
jgi:hypothetical protein